MNTSVPTTLRRPRYLTVRQTAWLLAVPTDTVWRWIRVGLLPTTSQRSRTVIPTVAVTRLMGGAR